MPEDKEVSAKTNHVEDNLEKEANVNPLNKSYNFDFSDSDSEEREIDELDSDDERAESFENPQPSEADLGDILKTPEYQEITDKLKGMNKGQQESYLKGLYKQYAGAFGNPSFSSMSNGKISDTRSRLRKKLENRKKNKELEKQMLKTVERTAERLGNKIKDDLSQSDTTEADAKKRERNRKKNQKRKARRKKKKKK